MQIWDKTYFAKDPDKNTVAHKYEEENSQYSTRFDFLFTKLRKKNE